MNEVTTSETVQFDQLRDIFRAEPLHPDLVPYLSEHPTLGAVLRHPLVYSIPHFDQLNRHANGVYAAKRVQIEAALGEGAWQRYVFAHERAYRAEAFDRIAADLPGPAYWELLAMVWTDCENVSETFGLWIDLWRSDKPGRQHVMKTDEQVALTGMPERLKLYRGVGHPDAVGGLSWTLDRTRATWFAVRFHESGGPSLLATGDAHKADVLGYLSGRNESEIVILPENVAIRSVVPVR